MGIKIEDVSDGGVDGEGSLSRRPGLELLLFLLPPSDRRMGVLRSIFPAHTARPVTIGEAQIPGRSPLRDELVGENCVGINGLVPQELSQQHQHCGLIATLRDQHAQNVTLVADCARQDHPPAADLHQHLVQTPPGRQPGPQAPQGLDMVPVEIQRPTADRLSADFDAPLGQQLFDVTQAEHEAEIQPTEWPTTSSGRRWRL